MPPPLSPRRSLDSMVLAAPPPPPLAPRRSLDSIEMAVRPPPPPPLPTPSRRSRSIGEPVVLNIYEFTKLRGSASALALASAGLGIYHSGVELRGVEHSFTVQGIVASPPKRAHGCRWVTSITVGHTMLTEGEVEAVIGALALGPAAGTPAAGANAAAAADGGRFSAETYAVRRRNCNHFADVLCRALIDGRGAHAAAATAGVSARVASAGAADGGDGRPFRGIPSWVNRAARLSSMLGLGLEVRCVPVHKDRLHNEM